MAAPYVCVKCGEPCAEGHKCEMSNTKYVKYIQEQIGADGQPEPCLRVCLDGEFTSLELTRILSGLLELDVPKPRSEGYFDVDWKYRD